MKGDSTGKIRSTPILSLILRTVKRFLLPSPEMRDNHTTVLLDTLLVAFLDTVSYGDGVARKEVVKTLAGREKRPRQS